MPYQIISTQRTNISLEGWSTREKTCPISMFSIRIPVIKRSSSRQWRNVIVTIYVWVCVCIKWSGIAAKMYRREIIIRLEWPRSICSMFSIGVYRRGWIKSIHLTILQANTINIYKPEQPNRIERCQLVTAISLIYPPPPGAKKN